jgi:hypothetical protein
MTGLGGGFSRRGFSCRGVYSLWDTGVVGAERAVECVVCLQIGFKNGFQGWVGC